MSDKITFDYFYGQEADMLSFYKIPKLLFTNEFFKSLSTDAKVLYGLMLDRISDNEQLIFTTHNTDMLDLNLPKHSFMFLRKESQDNEYRTIAISASDILKRKHLTVLKIYSTLFYIDQKDL